MAIHVYITVIIILLWIFIYTASYSRWNWKINNKIGAVIVLLLAVAAVVLPIYALFLRQY